MFGTEINLTLYTHSHYLYGLRISLAHPTAQTLLLNLVLIHEPYERGEISNIVWIEGKNNPADGLKKIDRKLDALMNVIVTNLFLPTVESWIQSGGK